MEPVEFLPLLSRWLHILASLLLVGGTSFLRFIILPTAPSAGGNEEFRESLRKRWSKLVAGSILFLLVSGLYNSAIKSIDYQLDSVYLTLLTGKILLALFVFFVVSVLAGRSGLAVRFRQREARWYDLALLAMLLIVLMAGYMKMSPQPLKIRDEGEEKLAAVVGSRDDGAKKPSIMRPRGVGTP